MTQSANTALGYRGFDNERCVAFLEGLMQENPEADCWKFLVSFHLFVDDEDILPSDHDDTDSQRGLSWPTSESFSAQERLTLPPEFTDKLQAILGRLQEMHVEAFDSLFEGLTYCFSVSRKETRLHIWF